MGRRPKWSRAAKIYFAAEKKLLHDPERNRCGAIFSRCFDITGGGISICFDGMKKVEMNEDDEGVSYLW